METLYLQQERRLCNLRVYDIIGFVLDIDQ